MTSGSWRGRAVLRLLKRKGGVEIAINTGGKGVKIKMIMGSKRGEVGGSEVTVEILDGRRRGLRD